MRIDAPQLLWQPLSTDSPAASTSDFEHLFLFYTRKTRACLNRHLKPGMHACLAGMYPIALAIGYLLAGAGPVRISSLKYLSTAHVGSYAPNNSTRGHSPGGHSPEPVTVNSHTRGFLAPFPKSESRVAPLVSPCFRVLI